MLKRYIDALPPTLPTLDDMGIVLISIYAQREQPEEWRKYDGMCFRYDVQDDPRPGYIVCISESAIHKGQGYVVATLLHEFAHAMHGEDVTAHDKRFRDCLEKLEQMYKAAFEDDAEQETDKPLKGHKIAP
jgi:hypothetical protein